MEIAERVLQALGYLPADERVSVVQVLEAIAIDPFAPKVSGAHLLQDADTHLVEAPSDHWVVYRILPRESTIPTLTEAGIVVQVEDIVSGRLVRQFAKAG